MNSIIIFSACIAVCMASPYSFGYTTADGQSRSESGAGGAVSGQYSYVDANGDIRQVRYVADAAGYRAEGDVSVDKRTAAAAVALAAMTPKAQLPAPISNIAPAPGPVHVLNAPIGAPIAAYSSWGQPLAWGGNVVAAPVAIAASPYSVVGPRGYSVHTPTHQIQFNI